MAETLLSPGVLARENDQSFIQGQPVERGAALIGPSTKGPVEIPTIIGSFSEYTAVFGGSVESGSNLYSYFNSIAASNYFQNGGNSLLVTRVTSGSFSPAVSSTIATGSGGPTDGLSPFVLETISEGEIMNTGTTLLSGGALATGSSDNIRWEIAGVNTSSGTFSLLVRRGDDTTNSKVVVEQYNNLSLDPYSSNYISKVIGDVDHTLVNDGSDYYIQESGSYANASRFIRVKQVNYNTPRYFDNTGTAKNEFTGSLPVVGSGSFNGAVGSNIPSGRAANYYNNISSADSQGLEGTDYTNAISLMSNVDEYKYNVIAVPGLLNSEHSTQITSIVNNTIARGDSISVIDLVKYNTTISTAITQASGFDSSYAATYWPWLQTIDPNIGEQVWIPASTMVPGVYAFTDASSDPWFAPAGITRGGLGQVTRAERKLSAGNRDSLYEANINPIATFPQSGVVVFGQKTLQKRASALDRINVRRLLISLKSFISQIADNLVFEQNSASTRNNFLSQVNPYLESVQQRQGLYAFKVVMDDTNNTPDVVDRNELIGQIFIQPTRTAEYIMLDFNVLPTGATFPA
ncbi:phage tail sheath subtilisin-like domain-containing protein [bacterium]|nr:phage tail sheath subtilisin-like domain-containing protein [bacterium]